MSDTGYSVVPRWILKDERFTLNMIATYLALQSFSGKDGVIFPSLPTLASRARISESSVRRALKSLTEIGVVMSSPRYGEDGRQTSNSYVVLTHDPVTVTPPPSGVTPTPSHPDTPPVSQGHPKEPHVSNPIEVVTPIGVTARAKNDLFDEFWSIYPRRVGKTAARAAWAKATQRALPEEINAGAMRYRNDPNREDRFTCHPSTWLNQGRWEDDPIPSRSVVDRRPASRVEQNIVEFHRLYGRQNGQQGSLHALDPGVSQGWSDRHGAIGVSVV